MDELVLKIGYSHPILYKVAKTVKVVCPKPTIIVIQGVNKEQVGLIAEQIRSLRKPNSYTGKGILYDNEVITLKSGKSKR